MEPQNTKRVNIALASELHKYLKITGAEKNQNMSETLTEILVFHKQNQPASVEVSKND